MNELEIIRYPQIEGMSLFFDTIDYRTAHFHPEWELLYVMDQPLMITSKGTMQKVLPGEMILFNPLEAHEFRKDSQSCTAFFLQFSPQLFSMAYPRIDYLFFDHQRISDDLGAEQKKRVSSLLFRMMDSYLSEREGYQLACLSDCAEVLRLLYLNLPQHVLSSEEIDIREKRTARLSRFLKYVDENYMHKIRLADFAESEKMSLAYMSVFIRNELGQTFQEYVNTVRFNAACKMIAAGDMSMQNVCLASGFSDYRYFSGEFRRRKAMTPEQYSRNQDPSPDAQKTHQSLHSLERFYSRARSAELLENYRKIYQ